MKFILLLFGLLVTMTQCRDTSLESDAFQGLWKLHIIETQDSSKQWVQSDWMKNGVSYLHYDGSETMSIHFTPEHFSNTNPNDMELDSLSLEELKMLASDYWYVGNYQINADSGWVQHERIIHSDPNEWGKIVRRHYELHNDTLILSAKDFGLRLKWFRAEERY